MVLVGHKAADKEVDWAQLFEEKQTGGGAAQGKGRDRHHLISPTCCDGSKWAERREEGLWCAL